MREKMLVFFVILFLSVVDYDRNDSVTTFLSGVGLATASAHSPQASGGIGFLGGDDERCLRNVRVERNPFIEERQSFVVPRLPSLGKHRGPRQSRNLRPPRASPLGAFS